MPKKKVSKKSPKKPGGGKPLRQAPRLLLVIDPAAAAGVALFVDGNLKAYAKADGSSWLTLAPVVSTLLHLHMPPLVPPSERLCAIEDGFISFHSIKGSLTLGRRRGIAQAAAEAAGITNFTFVGASTWQSKIFGGRVEVTKVASIALASCVIDDSMLVSSHLTDDEADAICIGDYVLRHGYYAA